MNDPMRADTLIPPTWNPALAEALAARMASLATRGGAFGILEALATLLGMIQNSLAPRIATVPVAFVAADHGFAAAQPGGAPRTADTIAALRAGRLPLAALARVHDATLEIVHASGADRPLEIGGSPPVLVNRTADARLGPAMTSAQAHAALRQGMREGERAQGGAIVCAGWGTGAATGAALVLGALTQRDPLEFIADADEARACAAAVRERHSVLWQAGAARDPVDVLAALGGYETGTLAGVILGAAARRQAVLVDGMAALAAVHVAMRIAPYVGDYCIPVRSRPGRGVDAALALWRPALPSALELDAIDGTAGVLALPVLRSAAALLAALAS
jgi:nicotinate-nucleotide--dimethylbenzimidazole phosphoribosyltransferase